MICLKEELGLSRKEGCSVRRSVDVCVVDTTGGKGDLKNARDSDQEGLVG